MVIDRTTHRTNASSSPLGEWYTVHLVGVAYNPTGGTPLLLRVESTVATADNSSPTIGFAQTGIEIVTL